jgi:hypothetical protein
MMVNLILVLSDGGVILDCWSTCQTLKELEEGAGAMIDSSIRLFIKLDSKLGD